MDHAIFRTVYDIHRLETKHEDAKVSANHWRQDRADLFAGWSQCTRPCMAAVAAGNEILNSQQVNANILIYALLQ